MLSLDPNSVSRFFASRWFVPGVMGACFVVGLGLGAVFSGLFTR